MNMEIRALTIDDLGEIAQIGEIETSQFHQSREQSKQSLLEAIANPNMNVLILEGEDCLGYIWYQFAGDYSEIISIYIDPQVRKQGLASRLIADYLQLMKNSGIVTVSLEVRASNIAAQKVYLKNGFEAVGSRKNYYQNPPEDGIIFNYEIV
ncbi:ribosomal protein S18-alanine N-acetyltransferase [Culicoidibacter larvae]|uniref:[Ribosomal protein bS18]-alanine N-acetyltransferase n=1 Tax=Culicoidibacter larvae TaxID=2579976 RepID=A0A5R8QBF4_9FIRM|nr:ribosomal protein S18-alanine N-acetyltransferase [Culicoidibacter larvae]TLG73909.1 ribosomal-protein-alanine N-acetyltransferase [Culicoidibacter larvae]